MAQVEGPNEKNGPPRAQNAPPLRVRNARREIPPEWNVIRGSQRGQSVIDAIPSGRCAQALVCELAPSSCDERIRPRHSSSRHSAWGSRDCIGIVRGLPFEVVAPACYPRAAPWPTSSAAGSFEPVESRSAPCHCLAAPFADCASSDPMKARPDPEKSRMDDHPARFRPCENRYVAPRRPRS